MRTLPCTLLSWLALAAALPAQATQMVSVDQAGGPSNGLSEDTDVSSNGRFVVFESLASDLVPGDTNGVRDIFLRDMLTGVTTRVSVSSLGFQANGNSWNPSITDDGQTVVFGSDATNLVPVDTNGQRDIFLKDMQSGQLFRMNPSWDGNQANQFSGFPHISGNGHFVVFFSLATNLVRNDLNGVEGDIFLFNRIFNGIELVSQNDSGVQGNLASANPFISQDGRYVVFSSVATNLVNGDTNGQQDVFVRDRTLKTTRRASVGTGGFQANGSSVIGHVSDDGRFVAFCSSATNLVSGDTNGVRDIFHHDFLTGSTVRVNSNASGFSNLGDLSADGLKVLFSEQNSGSPREAWLVDIGSGTLTLVSSSMSGGNANGASHVGRLTPDAKFSVFFSSSNELTPNDTNNSTDVFLHDNTAAQVNTITLSGPTAINTGSRFTYSWTNAPAFSTWTLYASGKKNGATIQGHPFDIGPKLKKLGSGTNNSAGSGSWLSPKIASKLSGRIFFLEVGAFQNGQVFDSNFLKVQIL
ncbi:MAG: TolB family protein [Planctomycetota bacterium]